ncbi:MAG: hypothetical protein ABI603_11565 [Acidobacteriota bacterium]
MRIVGLLIASIPVGFAALRAASTGTDFRYLWLAVVSTLGAAFVLVIANRRRPRSPGVVVRAALALLVAAGAAGVTALALGAHSLPAVLVVALGFATCSAAGLALALRSAPQR